MSVQSDAFRTCACGHVLDVFRYDRGEEMCACPKDIPVSEFPLSDHMKAVMEPHIQWRCDQALAQFVLEQAERVK